MKGISRETIQTVNNNPLKIKNKGQSKNEVGLYLSRTHVGLYFSWVCDIYIYGISNMFGE